MEINAVSLNGQEFDFERSDICANGSFLDQKVERTFLNSSHARHMMVTRNYGGRVEATISWGGKEKPTIGVGVKGEVRDNYGNYVETRFNRSSTGQKSAGVVCDISSDRPSSKNNSSTEHLKKHEKKHKQDSKKLSLDELVASGDPEGRISPWAKALIENYAKIKNKN